MTENDVICIKKYGDARYNRTDPPTGSILPSGAGSRAGRRAGATSPQGRAASRKDEIDRP